MKKPLLAGIAIYLGLVAVLLTASLALTGGSFTFAQDDPYIHLAMARTLAEHGVWGIAPDAFASASSSPLWTLLLAALWTLGAKAVWVPFVLNLIESPKNPVTVQNSHPYGHPRPVSIGTTKNLPQPWPSRDIAGCRNFGTRLNCSRSRLSQGMCGYGCRLGFMSLPLASDWGW